MTPRALTFIRHDLRLQYRYGIYAAYGFLMAFYVAVLAGAGAFLPPWAIGLIIFTDPAAVGFFFLGALMMLERAEGVRSALAVAPVAASDYLIGKTITLTAVALLACGVLAAFAHDTANLVLLLAAVALTSVAYVGIGVPIALRFRTVTGYLIGSGGFLIPVIAPGLLALLDPVPVWALIVPSVSQFRLILVGAGAATASATEIAAMLVVCLAAAVGAMLLALHFLRRELGR